METIIYLVVVALIIFVVFSLLPIILPIILILIIAATIYIWFLKRKITNHMDQMENDMDSMFDKDHEINPSGDDVIDVEYTEREDHVDQ